MRDAPRAASLVVLAGPLVGKRVLLDQAIDETLVGSDPTCGLCLEVPGVSPIHARIGKDAGGLTVYDTHSPRGVYVNDDRVADRATVRDGDVIWLGTPGDDQSVMLQCRVEAPAAVPSSALPVVAPPSDEEVFFVDEPPVASPIPEVDGTDFLVVSEPEVSAPAIDIEPVFDSPSEPVEEFFVEDAASEVLNETLVTAPPPAILPSVAPPLIPPAAPRPGTAVPLAVPPPEVVSPARAATVAPSVSARNAAAATSPSRGSASASPAVAAARTDGPRRNASGPRPASRRPSTAPVPVGRAERRPLLARPRMPGGLSRRHLTWAAAALLVLVAGGVLAVRISSGPRVRTVAPARVGNGLTVTLSGGGFSPAAAQDTVRFADGKPGRVIRASATELEVELPELDIPASGDIPVPVVVEVRGRSSAPVQIVVYQTPRIHGVSPSVAMPGEEVLLAGGGWSRGATVRFGNLDADVLEANGGSIRVRVPAIEGPPGTSAPVAVWMSGESSNPAPFQVGRLPLVTSIEPRSASAGDTVTIGGRGFHFQAARNVVRVGGARALVVGSAESELKVVVPWVAAAGEARVEVQVPGSDHVGDSSLAIAASPDPIEFRFAAEPFEEGHGDRAILATALGPVFVLGASGGRSAADRALEAQQRLNAAATALRASRDVDLETRGLGTQPEVALTGRAEALVTATAEDAAAYEEDWSKHGSKGVAVNRDRLALWWTAVARDLVLLLVRSEKPHFAAALAAEGRPLAELFMAARRSTPFGIPREIALQPVHKDVLRAVALRVPASVAAPVAAAAGPAPVVPAALPPAPAATAVLKLDGAWIGTEHEGGRTSYVTVTFRENGGTYALEGALSVTTPLSSVERPQKNTVRFSVQIRGGTRYFVGRWDGTKIAGKVTDDPGGRQEVGSFDLAPGR